jgi:TRAP-type C4-dicarboxylate transport system substrate-binding protein
VLVLLTIVFLTGIFPKVTAAPIVMKSAETHPRDYPTTKGDYEFAGLVKEPTNGRITIEFYHSKQLGKEGAVIEQIQLQEKELNLTETV